MTLSMSPHPRQPAHRLQPALGHPWRILAVLCVGIFMTLLDSTIVNVALPDLSSGLGASLRDLLWIINAYVLVFAVLLITAGRLGDLYGQKFLFVAGLAVFTAASAACGLAQTPAQLIGFRALQGLGSALLMPQTLALITLIFPPESRGRAFGVWGTVVGVATLTGPVLGGWLLTHFAWRSIFFVNVPVGVSALLAAAVVLPDVRLNRRHHLDLTGLLLSAGALFLITFGLINGQYYRWGNVWGAVNTVEILTAGVALLAGFVLVERRARGGEPLIPRAVVTDRNFALMAVVMVSAGAALLSVFLPLTVFLQVVLGLSPLQAGLTLAPMSLVSLLAAPVAGRLADRRGKAVLLVGVALFALSVVLLLPALRPDASRWRLAPTLILGGLGLGATFAPLQTIAMRGVAPQMAGAAAGIMNTARQVGGVLGVVASGALLQARLPSEFTSAGTHQAQVLGSAPARTIALRVAAALTKRGGDLPVGTGPGHVDLEGLPQQYHGLVQTLSVQVFGEGFTAAARVELWFPVVISLIGLLAVTFVRTDQDGTGPRGDGTNRRLRRRDRSGFRVAAHRHRRPRPQDGVPGPS